MVLLGPDGELLECVRGSELPELRAREGLYQITESLAAEERERWRRGRATHLDDAAGRARATNGSARSPACATTSWSDWRPSSRRASRRRRSGCGAAPRNGDESEIEHGDATSLKLEWERRAAEVRQRWALRTEMRLWGLEEWSWPVAELEQELRAGAVHVRLDEPGGRGARPSRAAGAARIAARRPRCWCGRAARSPAPAAR